MPLSRLACDRCHGQKLRCPRTTRDNNDSCSRCLKAGVSCVYSAPLPTGRPAASPTASRMEAARVDDTPISFELPVNAASWASPNVTNLAQFSVETDDTDVWGPQVLDFDNDAFNSDLDLRNLFTPNSVGDILATAGAQGRNTPPLPVTDLTESLNARQTSTDEVQAGRLPNLWPSSGTDTTEACIRQLSDLSVRSCPVYKTSCSFESAQKEHPGALLSSDAFETVSHFLRGENTLQTAAVRGCHALFEIFYSSRCLLDILHPGAESATGNDEHMRTTSSGLSPLSTSFPLASGLATSSTSPSTLMSGNSLSGTSSTLFSTASDTLLKEGDTGPDGVILHLFLACYIRLLHIYHTLIKALHRDALHIRNIGPSSTTSFLELRLVLFVQLIAHLVGRLRQDRVGYLSPSNRDTDGAMQLSLDTVDRDVLGFGNVSSLESTVREELEQLQKGLRI